MLKKDKIFENILALSTEYKIRIVKEELLNVVESIRLAKSNVVNSNILSREEVETIIENFDTDDMPYRNVEDILEFADVTVFHNSTHYFYIINVPKTHNVNYEEFLIKPVKRNNVINRIEYEYILKNGVDYFGIVEKCKNFNSLSICKDNNVRNISHTTCIPRLFKSSEARCNKTNGHHVPLAEEIAADTLLFNDFKGKVEINGTEQDLRGTYLIKFKNITITVNNQSYRSLETTNIQLLPPLLHVGIEKDELVEILSMELIKEMHINNTRQIKLLEAKKETGRWITYSSFSIIFIFLVVAKLFSIFKGSTKTRVVIEPSSKSQLKPTNLPQNTPSNPSSISLPNLMMNLPSKPSVNVPAVSMQLSETNAKNCADPGLRQEHRSLYRTPLY
ncbi:unnamed protein product [Hermetia illucens]|uniref:Envelope protein n=1 Tax=Hermetia illucens TaxID=343691 RepID=A0A7R8UD92_HERIL|nr:unnamed protein product [Hermetia illucens]